MRTSQWHTISEFRNEILSYNTPYTAGRCGCMKMFDTELEYPVHQLFTRLPRNLIPGSTGSGPGTWRVSGTAITQVRERLFVPALQGRNKRLNSVKVSLEVSHGQSGHSFKIVFPSFASWGAYACCSVLPALSPVHFFLIHPYIHLNTYESSGSDSFQSPGNDWKDCDDFRTAVALKRGRMQK